MIILKKCTVDDSVVDVDRGVPLWPFSTTFKQMGLDYWFPEYPPGTFSESQDSYLLQVELPGFQKNDLTITYDKGVLSLRGKREADYKGAKLLHRERFFGAFVRHFSLPEHIIPEQITSTYRDGILSITIPKKESARRKKIEISG